MRQEMTGKAANKFATLNTLMEKSSSRRGKSVEKKTFYS